MSIVTVEPVRLYYHDHPYEVAQTIRAFLPSAAAVAASHGR
jgi:hypothetical protein